MAIKFYHQSTCPQCRLIEKMLNDKGIEYESCDDIAKMQEEGIRHTPTLVVDDVKYIGKPLFDWIREH